jgi:hypothetical protein
MRAGVPRSIRLNFSFMPWRSLPGSGARMGAKVEGPSSVWICPIT